MKTSNSFINVEEQKDSPYYLIHMGFELHKEDYDMLIEAFNDFSDLWEVLAVDEKPDGIGNPDLGDFVHALITKEVHDLYETRHCRKFILRKDRPKKDD